MEARGNADTFNSSAIDLFSVYGFWKRKEWRARHRAIGSHKICRGINGKINVGTWTDELVVSNVQETRGEADGSGTKHGRLSNKYNGRTEFFGEPTSGRFRVLKFGGNVLCLEQLSKQATVNNVSALLLAEDRGEFISKANPVGEAGSVSKDEIGYKNSASG